VGFNLVRTTSGFITVRGRDCIYRIPRTTLLPHRGHCSKNIVLRLCAFGGSDTVPLIAQLLRCLWERCPIME
jgi:hypothetical protein